MKALLALAATVALLGACGRPDSTPLPTKQTAIDPVLKKLEAADQQAQKRREEMDNAAK